MRSATDGAFGGGALIAVGEARITAEQFADFLHAARRMPGFTTVPAHGLALVGSGTRPMPSWPSRPSRPQVPRMIAVVVAGRIGRIRRTVTGSVGNHGPRGNRRVCGGTGTPVHAIPAVPYSAR